MTDDLIHHIQYVTLAPHPDRNSLDNLFQLLDGLDVLERDRMLAWMYLAFLEPSTTQETAETEEERFERRYNKFEEKFRHTAIGVFEPFLVHAAVTYTLAYLRECSDKACLDAVIHKSQAALQVLHRRIAEETLLPEAGEADDRELGGAYQQPPCGRGACTKAIREVLREGGEGNAALKQQISGSEA